MRRIDDINVLYDASSACNKIVSKALGITEVARIAATEVKLREYLAVTWTRRSNEAAKLASQYAGKGKSPNQIIRVVDSVMRRWSSDVEKRVKMSLAEIYKLARNAAYKKVKGKTKASLQYDTEKFEVQKAAEVGVSFNVVDDQLIEYLETYQMFWIGEHYESNIWMTVSTTVKEVMKETGQNNKLAATTIKQRIKDVLGRVSVPGGFTGTSKQYFEGLAANAATTSRVYGQLRTFTELGVTTYTIVNPVDERTCLRCGHLDGKKFSVQDGVNQMEKELSAKNPDDIKSVHPWLSEKELLKISPKSGHISTKDSQALVASGQSIPPYHFRCRCTIDIDVESYLL